MDLDITIIDKLQGLLSNIISLKKKVSLFVVIRREDADTWDLVFGGDKIDTKINLDLITANMNRIFEKNEIVLFSRLTLLNSDHPFLDSINKTFTKGGGLMKIENTRIDNIFVKDAHLIYNESIESIKRRDEDELKEKDVVKAEDAIASTTTLENENIRE